MSTLYNSNSPLTSINSEQYKRNMADIMKSIQNLDNFTDSMDSRVDGILKAQQLEFYNAYKQHMYKIKEDFQKLQKQLQAKDALINNYQNQGRMALLMKRVNFLELQQKKLLQTVQKKNCDIREAQLERKILKSEIKRLEDKIKDLIRTNTRIQQKLSFENSRTYESIPTFSTQIAVDMESKRNLSKMITQQRSYKNKMKSLHERSQASQFSINPEYSSSEISRLHKEIRHLKKQNRDLALFNSRFIDGTAQMENFFKEIVNQIKKNIVTRKQVKECSLQDFRKEDKLELLIKILSNDDILVHLHEKLFGKKIKSSYEDISCQITSSKSKINALRLAKQNFPTLHSAKLN